MGRYQRGYIYEAFGAFHVRYRAEEIVDGKLVRVQRSHRLCTKEKGLTKRSTSVQRKCAEFMATVNAQVPGQLESTDLTVAAFWEHTYLPFIKDNLKPSTVQGYQQMWNQHLKDHFGTITLREYRKGMGSTFLTKLAKTYRPHTLKHIKNLASGIFTHAANLDFVETNPWTFCKVLGKTLPDGETGYYSLEEIENIISALVEHADCQLIMALAYFLGLRKGEIQGLQWSDIDADFVHVRRNVVRGHILTLKGKKKEKDLPLIQPVKGLLGLWRAKSKGDGVWVFDRNLMTVARKTIMPVLEKNKLEWKGFHAGRRGLGTILKQLTGNSTAGRDILGHTDEVVTQEHYEKFLLQSVVAPLKMLEAKVMVEKNEVEK